MNKLNFNEEIKYKDEVKQKYGKTKAYHEYKNKTKNYSKDQFDKINKELALIFKEFSGLMNKSLKYNSKEAQTQVKKLKTFITNNYYTCTNEILYGLGQMYINDERFKINIDKYSSGTAEYINNAINFFCGC